MKAFHSDPAIKSKYLSRVEAHAAADEIIHGIYWEDGKGCAVGCTIHGSDHARYETELGIPLVLARLEDCIFEGMGNGNAKDFPRRFLIAIRPGADLSTVAIQFLIAVQERNLARLDQQQWPDVAKATNATLEVLRDWLHGQLDECAAESAKMAAWSAAESAAWSAEYQWMADKLIELLETA